MLLSQVFSLLPHPPLSFLIAIAATWPHFRRYRAMATPGMIALHAHQSWATRNQADGDDHMENWATAVRFHGSLLDEQGSHTPAIVYVNLFRGLLWPTPKQLRAHSHAQVLFAHLFSDTTACQAIVVARGAFVSLLTPARSALIAAMATGVWRILVGKCYERLIVGGALVSRGRGT